eukprot:1154002-Amphidinium_carterae.1
MSSVDGSTRRALWGSKKNMHSFPIACALVYSPHRIHAWSSVVHEHLRATLTAMQGLPCEELEEFALRPLRVISRGPLHT